MSRQNPMIFGKRKSLEKNLKALAEAVGFEPTVPCGTTDFESVPL